MSSSESSLPGWLRSWKKGRVSTPYHQAHLFSHTFRKPLSRLMDQECAAYQGGWCSPPQRHGSPLISHPQQVKDNFSNTHFVGEKVLILILQHCIIFLQVFTPHGFVGKRLGIFVKAEISKVLSILYLFLNNCTIFTVTPYLRKFPSCISAFLKVHFLFPENPLSSKPKSISSFLKVPFLKLLFPKSLMRVHSASETFGLLSLFPLNNMIDL